MWPCAWGGCIFAGNSKSGRRKFAYVNIALHSPSQEDRPTVTETHKNKTGSVGQGHPTHVNVQHTRAKVGYWTRPQRACAGQLRSAQASGNAPAAGGSSLVRVCQRSTAVSSWCRQSLQCFWASPRAPGPRDTPPEEQARQPTCQCPLSSSLTPGGLFHSPMKSLDLPMS